MGNLNRYTVQCALIANMYNEKVFVFVWIWMTVVAMVTVCSFLFWFSNCAFPIQRTMFVLKFLRIAATQQFNDSLNGRSSIYSAPTYFHDRFIDQYLSADGVFALRMIANHAGDVVCMELVKRLWRSFRESQEFEPVIQSPEMSSCIIEHALEKQIDYAIRNEGGISFIQTKDT